MIDVVLKKAMGGKQDARFEEFPQVGQYVQLIKGTEADYEVVELPEGSEGQIVKAVDANLRTGKITVTTNGE